VEVRGDQYKTYFSETRRFELTNDTEIVSIGRIVGATAQPRDGWTDLL